MLGRLKEIKLAKLLASDSLDVDVKSATPCDGNNILPPLFFLLFFSSRVQKGLLSRFNSVEAVSSVSIKLLVLFYQIRYSRENKRQSLFWFLKCKTTNAKWNAWLNSKGLLPLCGFLNYAKIRVSRQIHLHRATTI